MNDAPKGGKEVIPADPAQEIIKQLTPTFRPEKRGEAISVLQGFVQKLHIGPLPAPEDFAHYEQTCAGSSGRILTMAEKNQEHRHAMERDHLRLEYGLQSRGQWLAISALVFMLCLIGFALWIGQPIAASVLGSATILGIVGMFLGRDRGAAEPEPERPAQKKGKQGRRR